MRFFNPFTPARTEIVNKKSIDVALCGRSERPQNRVDATPCSSDVYNIGTRARRRTVNIILPGQTFLRRVLQIRRDFLTTCTQKSTRGKKSQVDVALCGKSKRPQNRTDATPCLSDVYNIGTRARRRLADVRLSGRSMVEMLGVLAISGVLSVGAISGYSKAMMKYKLNKHAAQISELINTVHMYQYEFHFETDKNLSLIPIYQKLNVIPESMRIVEASNPDDYLKDAFGTYNAVYINRKPYNAQTMLVIYGKPQSEFPITFPSLDIGISYCRNILSALQAVYKDNPNRFCYIYLRNQPGGGKSINLNSKQYNFANMSIAEMTNICEQQLTLTDIRHVYFQFCFRNTK